ncbi:MAG: DUF6630 family protein [Prevotella sp.]
MTKEERAEKWFRNIPNAETIDLETRMEICSKVAKRMILVFFAVFALELVLLSVIVGDDFFNGLADFVNSLIGGSHNRGSRNVAVIVAAIVCAPLIALPLIATLVFKKRAIASAVNRTLGITNKGETRGHGTTDKDWEQLSGWMETFYPDWDMVVGDTTIGGFTPKDVRQQLAALKPGTFKSILMWAHIPIKANEEYQFNHLSISPKKQAGYFKMEVFTSDIAHDNHIINYEKDKLSEREVMEVLHNVLNDNLAGELQSWKVVMDYLLEKSTDAENYKTIAKLLPDGDALFAKVERCIDAPKQYLIDNMERFREREMDENERNCDIIWAAIANEMLDNGNAVEVDWEVTKQEFCLKMKGLADKYHLTLNEDWLNEDDEIDTWCDILNKQWADWGLCVAKFTIVCGNFGYLYFIYERQDVEKLSDLCMEVNQCIDVAKEI